MIFSLFIKRVINRMCSSGYSQIPNENLIKEIISDKGLYINHLNKCINYFQYLGIMAYKGIRETIHK